MTRLLGLSAILAGAIYVIAWVLVTVRLLAWHANRTRTLATGRVRRTAALRPDHATAREERRMTRLLGLSAILAGAIYVIAWVLVTVRV